MATAIAAGLVRTKRYQPDQITAADPNEACRTQFQRITGVEVIVENQAVVEEANTIILAVKPQNVKTALTPLRGALSHDKLIISIAAGITLADLESASGGRARLVRVMPNTPFLVGQGAAGYCLGESATEEDAQLVERLFDAGGLITQVPESVMNAVTGLSGGGPAYAFLMIEALRDGGVRMGLARDVATRLAAQTILGAATMVLETSQHPGQLKDQVTSPGGSTIAGLEILETDGVRGSLMRAVQTATIRAGELGE
jgi:pyrroline-5-carboxylate reductase